MSIFARLAGCRVIASLALMVFWLGATAHAVTRTWVLNGNGNWVDGPNWSGGVAPTIGDPARIDNGYTASVNPGNAATCSTLYLGYYAADSGYVSMSGGTFTAAGAAHIGRNGTGGFSVSGGSVSFDGAYVGNDGNGTLTITGSGTTVDVTGELNIGYGDTATGTVTVTSGTLMADTNIVLGQSGTAYLTQNSGLVASSTVSSTADLILAPSAGSHAYYTMYGGSVSTCDLYVGKSGSGSFSQSGGTVNVGNQGTADHHLYLASGTGSGTYRLSNTGVLQLSKNNNGSTIFVADSSGGTGRFEWFRSGGINRPSGGSNPMMNVAATGTLAMGYDFNVSTLASGGYISLTGLNLAGLEVTNGCTATHNQDDWTVKTLRIGSATGAGTYNLGGGGASAIGRVSQDLYLGATGNLGTLNVNANGQAIVTGNIVGDLGASTVNLNRSEGISFGTSFSVGTFNIGPTSAAQFTLNTGESLTATAINVGSSVTGTLNIAAQNVSVGTLTLKNGTLSGTSGTITASGAYVMESGTAGAKLAGNVNLTKQTAGNVTLSNAGNTYGGTTYVNGGKLIVSANGCLGTQFGHVEFSGGTLRTTASLETYRDMAMNAGGGTFEVDSGTTLTHRGIVGGTGSLTKTGSGTLYLYATGNNWAGGTYINGGEVWTGNSSVIPNNLVSINSATLNLVSHTENIGALTLSNGTVAYSGGTLGLGGDVTSSGTSSINEAVTLGANRTFNVTGGTLTVGGAVSGSGLTATLTGAGNAKILMASAGTSNANYTAGGGGGGRMLGGDNTVGTALFTGNIALSSAVTLAAKAGGTAEFSTGTWTTNNNALNVGVSDHTGTVKLSNDLSTSAAVNVNYGTLCVNGTLGGGGSSLTVANGAALQGTGTIAKPVVVNGSIVPGNSIGTLHVNNTLSLAGASLFDINPNPLAFDKIDQISTLTYGGTLNVVNVGNINDFASGQVFDLFDFTSQSGTFSTINLPSLPNGLEWKMFGSQRFNYATGEIQVEAGTLATHYGLAAAVAVAPNVLLNGYVGAVSSITCTGSGSMDTLDFTGLFAVSSPGGQVSGSPINGSDVQHGQTVPNEGLSFRGTAYTQGVIVMPRVASATNHTIGGPAIRDWTNTAQVTVGLAKAGPGKDRREFGPLLAGQGELKTLPGGEIVRDYADLASKTLPSTWLEDVQTLGTEAIIREGVDSDAGHTVRMEWRQRFDGPVDGLPGSEIPETTLLTSDVLRLTGMDTGSTPWPEDRQPSDVFALQMTYVDPGLAGTPHKLVYLDLGEDHQIGGIGLDADRWLGAERGNFGGTLQPLLHVTWEDFRLMHPEPLTELVGYRGYHEDGPDSGRAWAVIDYNNAQFAVPEPGTLALLGAAAVAGLWAVLRRCTRKS